MPRNFDEERKAQDMSFVIRGETFKMKFVRPELIAEWEDEADPKGAVDNLTYQNDKIKLFIENSDGSHERWDALRLRDDDPISLGELNELIIWMMEVQSARPTSQPSPSSPGRGRTAASSKAG